MNKPLKEIDTKQDIRIRRSSFGLLGAILHTTVCILLYRAGLFRTTLLEFIELFAIFWSINIFLFYLIASGINKRFKEPSLTLPIMIWAFICVIITTYLANDLRMLLLTFCLLTLSFGTFRLTIPTYVSLNILLVFMYSTVVILLYKNHPGVITLEKEYITIIGLALTCIFCTLAGFEIINLRQYLHKKNTELAAALKHIEFISITDELTGIRNRRYILDILEQQRLITERIEQHVFTICMFDLDNFKHMNDAHGHFAGDQLLINFSQKILSLIRKTDFFARYGGEEFLLVCPFTTKENAFIFCDRIRENIEKSNLLPSSDEKITVSIGITQYLPPEAVRDTLLRLDTALYTAKQNGRNQVIVL